MRRDLTVLRFGFEDTDKMILSAHSILERYHLRICVQLAFIVQNQLRSLVCVLLYGLFSRNREFHVLGPTRCLHHVDDFPGPLSEVRLRPLLPLYFKCLLLLRHHSIIVFYELILETWWKIILSVFNAARAESFTKLFPRLLTLHHFDFVLVQQFRGINKGVSVLFIDHLTERLNALDLPSLVELEPRCYLAETFSLVLMIRGIISQGCRRLKSVTTCLRVHVVALLLTLNLSSIWIVPPVVPLLLVSTLCQPCSIVGSWPSPHCERLHVNSRHFGWLVFISPIGLTHRLVVL